MIKEIIHQVNEGYEDLVSSSPKKRRAAYFKRATDILMSNDNAEDVQIIVTAAQGIFYIIIRLCWELS